MQNTVGNLFSVFSSEITILYADIRNVISTQYFFYLSSSNVSLSNCHFADLFFEETGGFGSIFEGSQLQIWNSEMTNFTSLEHGVLSVQSSLLAISYTLIASFNTSLISAQKSTVLLTHLLVQDGRISIDNNKATMIPDGGVLNCLDCSIITLIAVSVSDVFANNGGVLNARLAERFEGKVTILDSKFERCGGKMMGGVLDVNGYIVDIRNSVFVNNTAHTAGVIHYQGTFNTSIIQNNTFTNNSAAIDGSCVRWVGIRPSLVNNTYIGNSALYGNPEASTPHHFRLLDSTSMQPVLQFPVLGVTGQPMQPPLVIGLFDAIDQPIVTDNSTLVIVKFSAVVTAAGNAEVLIHQGIAEFSLIFTPFSQTIISLNFSSDSPEIAQLSIPYQFRDCQPGEIRTDTGCNPCSTSSYSFNPADSACHPCFPNAECEGRTDVHLHPGYWRSDNLTDELYECLTLDSCLGGRNSACRRGYERVLCGVCEKDFYQFGLRECRDCADEVSPEGRGFIIAVLVLISVSLPPQLAHRTEGRLYHLALTYRIFLDYAHMSLYLTLLHVKWPFVALVHHEVLRTIGSLGAVLVYSGCQFTHFGISAFSFGLIATAFFPLLLVPVSLLISSLISLKNRNSLSKSLQIALSDASISLYNFLPMLSLMVITAYQCKEVAGSSWLVADFSQKCWESQHLSYIFRLTIPVLVFLVAFVGFAVCCVLKSPLEAKIMMNLRNYLTAGYKRSAFYWEIIVISRKFSLLFLSLAYPQLDSFSHILLFACILGLSLHFHIKVMPYLSFWLNLLSILAMFSLITIVYTAVDGSQSALSTLSCLGSVLVLLGGTLAFGKRKSTKITSYEMVQDASLAGLRSVEPRGRSHGVSRTQISNETAGISPSSASGLACGEVNLQVD